MLTKILIANRGEIACRIAKTARSMGIQTVAVYSDADESALHTLRCDEAFHIGSAAPAQSYLCGEKVIQIAKQTGAQAIHPGYGFLSENSAFAQACTDNDLIFIGPSPESIRSMGSKNAARRLMSEAGVPVLPGYDGDDQSEAILIAEARKIGFPLLIKATAGGGGKGMRVVEYETDMASALSSVKRESLGAFGDDSVLLERYLPETRHIEVQIFADSHGNIVHLFERDCSMQRRHQKVLEEAPAPGLNEALRKEMTKVAIQAARAISYQGAGTIEFLLAPDDQFYFMEMNTRLQVEHPVTEMICDQDLVEWQLRVADGEPLPLQQSALTSRGHALEARIYAENTEQGFLPSTGPLDFLSVPKGNAWVRVETGVRQGDVISPHYDPMIAKLVVWGDSREHAVSRLHTALKQFRIIGPNNNVSFLSALCSHPAFIAGGTNTRFIESNLDQLINSRNEIDVPALIAASLLEVERVGQNSIKQYALTQDTYSPWAITDDWRVTEPAARLLTFNAEKTSIDVLMLAVSENWDFSIQDQNHVVKVLDIKLPQLSFSLHGERIDAVVQRTEFIDQLNGFNVLIDTQNSHFQLQNLAITAELNAESGGGLTSPMPGSVIACYVAPGDNVQLGQALIVVEAMKMEHTVSAPADGTIAAVHFTKGAQVKEGDILLAFEQ